MESSVNELSIIFERIDELEDDMRDMIKQSSYVYIRELHDTVIQKTNQLIYDIQHSQTLHEVDKDRLLKYILELHHNTIDSIMLNQKIDQFESGQTINVEPDDNSQK